MNPTLCPEHRRYVRDCPGCKRYTRERASIRRRLMATGRWEGNVPIEQVRPHLRTLLLHMTYAQLAAKSGVDQANIRRMATGPRTYAHPDVAAAILGVPIPTRRVGPPAPTGQVPSLGSRRRLQALAAEGHHMGAIAAECAFGGHPVARWTLRNIADGRGLWVTVETAAAIADAYRRLSDVPGPSTITATRAREKGWHGVLAWDDDTIDDPAARPAVGNLLVDTPRSVPRLFVAYVAAALAEADTSAVAAALDGYKRWEDLSPAEKDDAIRTLTAAGCDHATIAARLRTTHEAVNRHASRHALDSFVPSGRAA